MTYVLGDATTSNAPLRLQNTVAGDGWESLARAYLGDGSMASQRKVMLMQPFFASNGVKSNAQVQNFIKALPGWSRDTDIFPYSSSNNPGTRAPDGSAEGFAHFGPNTQLMLPDMPRLDGKVPKGGTKPSAPVVSTIEEASMAGPIILIGALTVGTLIVLGKRKKKKGAPKPVAF